MIFHTNTTNYDFIEWLRYAAIEGSMPSQFIDCIDCIDCMHCAPSEYEIAVQINAAVEDDKKSASKNGREDGLADRDRAVEAAEVAMYKNCCNAIKAKGAEIGLTAEQIYKVVNHILWDIRP
jgi:hypothetical protein